MLGTTQFSDAVMDSKLSPGAFPVPGPPPGKPATHSLQMKLSGGGPVPSPGGAAAGPAVARRASRGVAAKAGEFSVRVYNMIEECHDKTPEIATWIVSEEVPDDSSPAGMPPRSAVARGGFLVHDANGLVSTYFEAYEFVNRNTAQPTTFISFQRQLNNYGFSVRSPDGNVKVVRHEHDLFRRGRPDLVKHIKKNSNTNTPPHIGVHSGPTSVATGSSSSGEVEGIANGGSGQGGTGTAVGTEKKANAATIQQSITELRSAMVKQTNKILLKLGADESELLSSKRRAPGHATASSNSAVSRGGGSTSSVSMGSSIGISSVSSSCLGAASTDSDNLFRRNPGVATRDGAKKADGGNYDGAIVEQGAVADDSVPAAATPSPGPTSPLPTTPASPANPMDTPFTARGTDNVSLPPEKKGLDGAKVSPLSSPVKSVTEGQHSAQPSPLAEDSAVHGDHERQHPPAATLPAVQETDFDDEASDDFYDQIVNILDADIDDEVEFEDMDQAMHEKAKDKEKQKQKQMKKKRVTTSSPPGKKKIRIHDHFGIRFPSISKRQIANPPPTPVVVHNQVDPEGGSFDRKGQNEASHRESHSQQEGNGTIEKSVGGLSTFQLMVLVLLVLISFLQLVAIILTFILLSRDDTSIPFPGPDTVPLAPTPLFSSCVDFAALGRKVVLGMSDDVVTVSLSSNGSHVAVLAKNEMHVWKYQNHELALIGKSHLRVNKTELSVASGVDIATSGVDIALSGDASIVAVISKVPESSTGVVQTFFVPAARILHHMKPFWITSQEDILPENATGAEEETRNFVALSEEGNYLLFPRHDEEPGAVVYEFEDLEKPGFVYDDQKVAFNADPLVSLSLAKDEDSLLWTLAAVTRSNEDPVGVQFGSILETKNGTEGFDCQLQPPGWHRRAGVAIAANGRIAALGCRSDDFGSLVSLFALTGESGTSCGSIAPPAEDEIVGFPGSISWSHDGRVLALESQKVRDGGGGGRRRRVLLYHREFELSECSKDSSWTMISDGLEDYSPTTSVSVAALSSNGDVLATVDTNGDLSVRQVRTASCI